VAVVFDPWTSSTEQAEHAGRQRRPGQPDPVQQHQAAQEVLFARDMCLAPGGWWQVMHCVSICGKAQLAMPGWLADLFSETLIQVRESEHGSFDKIVGTLAKSKARENKARFRESQTKQIRQEVDEMAERKPSMKIIEIFEIVARMDGINVSAGTVKERYYSSWPLPQSRPRSPREVKSAREREAAGFNSKFSDQTLRIDSLLHRGVSE
jgi:hypothetical protein